MALVTPSPIIGAISGKIGSSVFAHSSAGQTIRSTPRVIKHHSSQSLALKAALARTHNTWHSVTESEYLSWRSYAENHTRTNALGTRQPITAHQMFLRQSILSQLLAAESNTYPRQWSSAFSIGSISLSFTAGSTYYVLLEDTYPPVGQLVVAASRPVRSTATRTFKNWRIIFNDYKVSAPGNDISAAFDATLGAPAAGEVIGIAVRFDSLFEWTNTTRWYNSQVTMA